ncbi:MAG: T9SS type A sorting domain-containing protein, partial [Candidatus Marinimicrobia bacterium]|nr:T9SS type A sorting domain-containing protein [Candidatus Neomarinimicrobiota bacterium]MCF7851555.1 T9SS type A sorting domain-containing protein [Candidatus Neomarinimicrobiota bacterium]MCF7904675.1 T9SS type A sorting domain-containing protein [Candidatus Neomarinimicrobiota bacterium]
PQLISLDGRETGGVIDPRPAAGGPAYQNVDTVPADDFFQQTTFKGAFGSTNWLNGWSWLDEVGRLGHVSTDGSYAAHVPNSVRLVGNYPNPFNPSTKIRFELVSASDVVMSVYDVNGRLVSETNMGQMSQGVHEVSWNSQSISSADVATGLYIYQIKTAGEVLTGKMMLLK